MWRKLNTMINDYFDGITLADLVYTAQPGNDYVISKKELYPVHGYNSSFLLHRRGKGKLLFLYSFPSASFTRLRVCLLYTSRCV